MTADAFRTFSTFIAATFVSFMLLASAASVPIA